MAKNFEVDKLRVAVDVASLAARRGWSYSVAAEAAVQSLEASRGLPEDRAELERRGRERAALHHYAGEGGAGLAAVERWYAELYAPSQHRFDESFVCAIPDALLVGPLGIAITPQWEVLAQSNLGAPPAAALLWALRDAADPPSSPAPGTHVSLLAFASKSYAHWLLDCLPRLSLVAGDPSYRVVIPAEPTRFQLETLALLGIGEERIVRQTGPVLHVERLLLVRTASRLTDPRACHLLDLRERFLEAAGGGPAKPPHRRLYVSRAQATRPVVNEAELAPLLARFGFEVVTSEALSFAAQVRLFSEAAVVLGAHGAGMHNHLFNRSAATVVELFNPRLWTPSVLRTAAACGHPHHHTFVENVGGRLQTRVPPERLERLLEQALQ